jgi:hypothetical protein
MVGTTETLISLDFKEMNKGEGQTGLLYLRCNFERHPHPRPGAGVLIRRAGDLGTFEILGRLIP